MCYERLTKDLHFLIVLRDDLNVENNAHFVKGFLDFVEMSILGNDVSHLLQSFLQLIGRALVGRVDGQSQIQQLAQEPEFNQINNNLYLPDTLLKR